MQVQHPAQTQFLISQLNQLIGSAKKDLIEHLKHELRKDAHTKHEDANAAKYASKEQLLQQWRVCLAHRAKQAMQVAAGTNRDGDDDDDDEDDEDAEADRLRLFFLDQQWQHGQTFKEQTAERLQMQIIDISHQLKLQRERRLQSALQLCEAIQARDAGPSNPCTQELNKWNLAIELAEGYLSKRIAQEKATFEQVARGEEELIKSALEAQYASLRAHCAMHIASVREQEERLSKYYASVLETVHERTMAEMQAARAEAERAYAETHLQRASEQYAAIYDRFCNSILASADQHTQIKNSGDISEKRLKMHDQLLQDQRAFMGKLVRTLNKIEACYVTAVMDVQEEIRKVQEHTHRSAMWLQTLNMFNGEDGVFKFWRHYGQEIAGGSAAAAAAAAAAAPDLASQLSAPSPGAASQQVTSGTLANAVSRIRALGPTLFGARLSSLCGASGLTPSDMAAALFEVVQEADGNPLMLKLVQKKLAVIERKAVYRRRKLRLGMLVHCICVLRRRAKAARLPRHMRVQQPPQAPQHNGCRMN